MESQKWLYGNSNAIESLVKNYNLGKVPQSIIFSGPKGIGKFTLALNFSKQLITGHDSIVENDLRLCIDKDAIVKNIYLCQKEYDEVARNYKTNITIQQIRKLKEFFSLSQTENKWRIAVIDSADDMNESSSNAILKLLEEPPSRSIIIIISHNFYKLKSTIVSRCQKISLVPLGKTELEEFTKTLKDPKDDNGLISSLSEGIPANALNFSKIQTSKNYNKLIDIFNMLPNPIEGEIIRFIGSMKSIEPDIPQLDLNDMVLMLINRLARSIVNDKHIVINKEECELLQRFSSKENIPKKLAELYRDLQITITRANRVNIEKAETHLNCLLKVRNLFRDHICH